MYHEMILALGCFLILLNGIHLNSFRVFLLSPILQFYGKISYSLYLFHLPVLYGLSYWLLREYDLLMVKVTTFILATMLAWASYVTIELGGIRLAKRILK
jgi:peptidoglycan/LPS O-acetylase OafA/YrhL